MCVYDFGLRLKELRNKRKLSQAEAADRLGVSKNTVYCYENNLKMPSVNRLADIAILYDCSLDYIMGLDNTPSVKMGGLTKEQQDAVRQLVKAMASPR